jgi:hypothetical protein
VASWGILEAVNHFAQFNSHDFDITLAELDEKLLGSDG